MTTLATSTRPNRVSRCTLSPSTGASSPVLPTGNRQHQLDKVLSYIARYPVKALYTSPPPPPADLFIPTPTRLLWEAFSHSAINARRLFADISTTVYSRVLIYTAE